MRNNRPYLKVAAALTALLSASAFSRAQIQTDWGRPTGGIVVAVEDDAIKGGEYNADGIIDDWEDVLKRFDQYGDADNKTVDDIIGRQKKNKSVEIKLKTDDEMKLSVPQMKDENGIDWFLLTEEGIDVYMLADNPVYYLPASPELVRWIRFYAWKNRRWTARIFARYEKLDVYFKSVFSSAGVPEEMTELCLIESGCNPYALSSAGALGIWQLMPETARYYGLTVNELRDERKDLGPSTAAAAKLLKNSYAKTGDWILAAASYNCGAGRVLKQKGSTWESIRKGLPEETQKYIPSLVGMHYVWRFRKELGF